MLDTRFNLRRQEGFTLIELLVVILIIGILAAIAIPAFLGQRDKAQDSTAKSAVRNLQSEIEACWRSTDGYVACQTQLNSPGATSLPIGTGVGQVSVVDATQRTYELRATSKAAGGGANHTFTIRHNASGALERVCAPAGEGGCKADGTW